MTAAPLVGMGAMERGMSGGALHFELVPAMVGMVVHFLWTAFWGLLFAVLLWATRALGWPGFALGIAWGYVAGTLMSVLVLPAVGLKPMWAMPGPTVFVLDHLAFGLPLAVWALLFVRPADTIAARAARGSRHRAA